MKIQKSFWKSFILKVRALVTKPGIAVILVLLATAIMTCINLTHNAHAATSESYTIARGDTLSGIASRFGVNVSDLAVANGIANPNIIYAGQTIQIPQKTSGHTSNTSGTSSGSYANMIQQVFGPYGNQAVRVAMCESSLNPNAYNGVLGAAGLFQIIPSTWASTSYASQSVYNPEANIRAAHEIFARDGYIWSEWACKP